MNVYSGFWLIIVSLWVKRVGLPNNDDNRDNCLQIIFVCSAWTHSLNEFITAESTPEQIIRMGMAIEEIPLGQVKTTSLNLGYNHISTLPEYVFVNKSFKSLSKIELNQNKISTIHLHAFRGLRQLSSVILSDNNITSLDPYTFRFNPKLNRLDLSNNKISFRRLEIFLVSQSLETLIVSQNEISQIYEVTFMGLPNLKNLILERNEFRVIAPHSFKPLSKLQYLSLANTGVYRLSESMFNDNLPRIIDIQETPLGTSFEPTLKKVTNNGVKSLIKFDKELHIN